MQILYKICIFAVTGVALGCDRSPAPVKANETSQMTPAPQTTTPSAPSANTDQPNLMGSTEILLIITPAADAEAKAMAAGISATQEISERVRIVPTNAAKLDLLCGKKGVYCVESGKELPKAVSQLSDAEQLFAEAWRARVPESQKNRSGDGAKWDAEGFQKPDSIK